MASYAGLLELRGPRGHTVLDQPPGVQEAAVDTLPPSTLHLFMLTLLHKCSEQVWGGRGITLADVLFSAAVFEFPGIGQAHLVAFRRRLWPRQQTIAQLEQYWEVVSQSSSLRSMEPELRQLVESVFAQESEWVRAAVLQHLVDNCSTRLVSAPSSIEGVLTCERPSMTIPDDPRLHQLLRQLHAEVHAELRRQGKADEVRELPPAAPPALASRLQGSSSSSEESSPGTPRGQHGGGDEPSVKPSVAASSSANCRAATGSGPVPSGAADSDMAGGGGGTSAAAQCGLRQRRHG